MACDSFPQSAARRSLPFLTLCVAALALPTRPALAAEAAGKDFWLAFPENGEPGELSVQILGPAGTTGTVAAPGLGLAIPFSIPAGGLTLVALPPTVMLTAGDAVEPRGVRVTAVAPVVVYGANVHEQSSDSYLGLPLGALGTSYTVAAYTPTPGISIFESQFAVVATADATEVTVTPSGTIGTHPPGVPYLVSLDAGEAYQAQSNDDLSGTVITSNHRVAVFSGNSWTNVPVGTGFADHLVEQLLPSDAWGLDVFLLPSALRTTPEHFRVQAGASVTNVAYSTGGGVTLPPGGLVEASFSAALRIMADQPVLVSHLTSGGVNEPGFLGDPFLLVPPATERFAHGYLVATADGGALFPHNFVNLVVPAAAVGRVTLDGVRIAAAGFTAIGTTGFSYRQQAISPGSHRLSGPLPFGAVVYGFGTSVSYASPAGAASLPFVDGFEHGDLLGWSTAVP